MAGKRFFLIAGGTVAGLGAVLSITPPQFGNASGVKLGSGTPLAGGTSLGGGTSPSTGTTPTPSSTPSTTVSSGGNGTPAQTLAATPAATPKATPAATPKATPAATPKATHKAVHKAVHKPRRTKKATPKATPKKTSSGGTAPANTPTPASTPQAAKVSGTFTGAPASTIYGPVQVQITIVNSVITKATALVYPTQLFQDRIINQQAIPYLIQETLAAQSANIQGVGGASYTSQGWATSLQSAISKAGF